MKIYKDKALIDISAISDGTTTILTAHKTRRELVIGSGYGILLNERNRAINVRCPTKVLANLYYNFMRVREDENI